MIEERGELRGKGATLESALASVVENAIVSEGEDGAFRFRSLIKFARRNEGYSMPSQYGVKAKKETPRELVLAGAAEPVEAYAKVAN